MKEKVHIGEKPELGDSKICLRKHQKISQKQACYGIEYSDMNV